MDQSLPHFDINFKDWMKGNNTADEYPNGGLLANESGYNPFAYPGLLIPDQTYPTAAVGSNLKRSMIASSYGNSPLLVSGSFLEIVGVMTDGDPNTQQPGYFYEVDPNTGQAYQINTSVVPGTPNNYRLGFTDAETYTNYTVFTADKDLTFVNPSSGSFGITENWGHANGGTVYFDTSVPHPMGRFEEFIYVGDRGYLHQLQTNSFTFTTRYFTNIPDRYTVTALVQRGAYLLIAVAFLFQGTWASNYATPSKILLWDGFSQSFNDELDIDAPVTAFFRGGDGVVYVWTTKYFGYLNGSTFVKLRRLNNLVFKGHITSVLDGLMYADGAQLVRFSSAVPGGKKFFKIQNTTDTVITNVQQLVRDIPIIFTDGGVGGSGKNLAYNSLDGGTPGTKTFKFNRRSFQSTVKVRAVKIYTEGLNGGSINVSWIDNNGVTYSCGTFDAANSLMAAKRRWTFDAFSGPQPITEGILPVITITGNAKLRAVRFFYEGADDINNA